MLLVERLTLLAGLTMRPKDELEGTVVVGVGLVETVPSFGRRAEALGG